MSSNLQPNLVLTDGTIGPEQDQLIEHQDNSLFTKWPKTDASDPNPDKSDLLAETSSEEPRITRARHEIPLVRATEQLDEFYSSLLSEKIVRNGVNNDGFDDADSNYIIIPGDVLEPASEVLPNGSTCPGSKYLVLEPLGSGTFGQVAKCVNLATKELIAIKIIKNKPAYLNQASCEIKILRDLWTYERGSDSQRTSHIVSLKTSFFWRNHLCIGCELLGVNLYELVKKNRFQGLSLDTIKLILRQVLDVLHTLSHLSLIHCDLKPENILLKDMSQASTPSGQDGAISVKVIDLGSACREGHPIYTYIQSRFYRAPEVILGLPYDSSIDMWSLGCILAELFLGLPIFPGTSEHNQISRIIDTLGMPPDEMLMHGQFTLKYFRHDGRQWVFKSKEEWASENGRPVEQPKKYFNYTKIDDLISYYPISPKLSDEAVAKEKQDRSCFAHLLKGILRYSPLDRYTPRQVFLHPFFTGEEFRGDWTPLADSVATPRRSMPIPVMAPHSPLPFNQQFTPALPRPSPGQFISQFTPSSRSNMFFHQPTPVGSLRGSYTGSNYGTPVVSPYTGFPAEMMDPYGSYGSSYSSTGGFLYAPPQFLTPTPSDSSNSANNSASKLQQTPNPNTAGSASGSILFPSFATPPYGSRRGSFSSGPEGTMFLGTSPQQGWEEYVQRMAGQQQQQQQGRARRDSMSSPRQTLPGSGGRNRADSAGQTPKMRSPNPSMKLDRPPLHPSQGTPVGSYGIPKSSSGGSSGSNPGSKHNLLQPTTADQQTSQSPVPELGEGASKSEGAEDVASWDPGFDELENEIQSGGSTPRQQPRQPPVPYLARVAATVDGQSTFSTRFSSQGAAGTPGQRRLSASQAQAGSRRNSFNQPQYYGASQDSAQSAFSSAATSGQSRRRLSEGPQPALDTSPLQPQPQFQYHPNPHAMPFYPVAQPGPEGMQYTFSTPPYIPQPPYPNFAGLPGGDYPVPYPHPFPPQPYMPLAETSSGFRVSPVVLPQHFSAPPEQQASKSAAPDLASTPPSSSPSSQPKQPEGERKQGPGRIMSLFSNMSIGLSSPKHEKPSSS